MRRHGRTWRPSLRVPLTPHRPGERYVPVGGCGCETCVKARIDCELALDAQRQARIGELFDLDPEKKP